MTDSLSTWANVLIFVVSALAIWLAGTRLERDADVVSRRTGLGQAFTGMILLAAATSLPEFATTFTAIVFLNNPTLAVHNLLGGVAMQTALIGVADVAKRRKGALTYFSPRFSLLIEGIGVLVLLQLAMAGVMAEGVPVVFSVSGWLLALFVAYVGLMFTLYRRRGKPRWTPSGADDVPREEPDPGDAEEDPRSTSRVWLSFGLASLVVLVGGWFAAQSSDVLAEKTGLGSAFLGATLLAIATSLPELSTTIAASRHGRYPMAISNVFGSNAFDIVLLFFADILYRDGSVIAHAESSLVFVAAVGSVMTCIYVWGLMDRGNRTFFGLGRDTALVFLFYLAGMAVLYVITSGAGAHPR